MTAELDELPVSVGEKAPDFRDGVIPIARHEKSVDGSDQLSRLDELVALVAVRNRGVWRMPVAANVQACSSVAVPTPRAR